MLTQISKSMIKLALMFAGGFLVQKGIVSEYALAEGVGALMAAGAAIWSAYGNIKNEKVPREVVKAPEVQDVIGKYMAVQEARKTNPDAFLDPPH